MIEKATNISFFNDEMIKSIALGDKHSLVLTGIIILFIVYSFELVK